MTDASVRSSPFPTAITVPAGLNGPPGSANGGVAAGMVGSRLAGPVRVRLFRPPPLDRPLEVRKAAEGLEARYRGELVLAAAPGRFEGRAPDVTIAEAARASAPFVGHAAVTCVVCGPDHVGGLRLSPGPVGEGPIHATTWTPPAWVGDGVGMVRTEIVWGVLDCPGAIMLLRHYPEEAMFPALGTITAEVFGPVHVGREYAVIAWPRGRDGRKLYAGTAVVDASGDVRAQSEQICIAMPFGWGASE